MPLVEPPVPADRDPRAALREQGQLDGADGPGLQRGVDDVGADVVLGHEVAGRRGLGLAERGEGGVPPAGEEVELVPLALAVAEQHESGHGGTLRGGRSAGRVHVGRSCK